MQNADLKATREHMLTIFDGATGVTDLVQVGGIIVDDAPDSVPHVNLAVEAKSRGLEVVVDDFNNPQAIVDGWDMSRRGPTG